MREQGWDYPLVKVNRDKSFQDLELVSDLNLYKHNEQISWKMLYVNIGSICNLSSFNITLYQLERAIKLTSKHVAGGQGTKELRLEKGHGEL